MHARRMLLEEKCEEIKGGKFTFYVRKRYKTDEVTVKYDWVKRSERNSRGEQVKLNMLRIRADMMKGRDYFLHKITITLKEYLVRNRKKLRVATSVKRKRTIDKTSISDGSFLKLSAFISFLESFSRRYMKFKSTYQFETQMHAIIFLLENPYFLFHFQTFNKTHAKLSI